MSDIVQRLRGLYDEWNSPHSSPDGLPTGASVMLEAAARIAKLEAALRGARSWLADWAVHAGRCEKGLACTCGLTAIRFETSAALTAREKTDDMD